MSVLFVKQRNSVYVSPFERLRDNVGPCDSTLTRWKARNRLFIGHNIRFNITFTANIYTPLIWNGSTTTLSPEAFTQGNFVVEFIRLNCNCIRKKTTNSLYGPPSWGIRCNVRTSSIARWKARGRLSICDNRSFFASCYGWKVISRYWSKSANNLIVCSYDGSLYTVTDWGHWHDRLCKLLRRKYLGVRFCWRGNWSFPIDCRCRRYNSAALAYRAACDMVSRKPETKVC